MARRLRSLAVYIVGPRTDWEFMVDPLVSYLRTALGDFWLTHKGDNQGGWGSPQARRAWLESRLAAMQAWDAYGVPLNSQQKPERTSLLDAADPVDGA